ncbi:hypothetical protein AB6A40_003980 [Gnathostoma spinigerum]|uniref:NEDD8-activating enzyme E1 regulatory subunit n=1 Tax=Gnathostoma spinigerum TaxID=75299 RepID=A0ABD6EC88_9BILA
MTEEYDIRYDRQLRLWGHKGQTSIENASVCVLGSSALASELLKNLVLAGIKSFYIVDDAVVSNPDVGGNFFVTKDDVGKSRAQVVTRWLIELNPSVKGDYDVEDINRFLSNRITKLASFAVVVGANLYEKSAVRASQFCYDRNIPFIHTRVFGLVGIVRVSVKEHCIIMSHDENPQLDVRLDAPFPELKEFAENTDLDDMTYEAHAHTPFLLLYLKALEKWRKEIGDPEAFPDVRDKRTSFLKVFLDMRRPHPETDSLNEPNFSEGRSFILRCLHRSTVPSHLKTLFEQSSQKDLRKSRFWLLIAAIGRFVEQTGFLPLSGELPDMISDSERYVKLVSLFRTKAEQDAREVFRHLLEILEQNNLRKDLINFEDCRLFCRNCSQVKVQKGTTIKTELESKLEEILQDVRNADITPNSLSGVYRIHPALWYILIRAVDRFYAEKLRFPGTNGVPCTIDSHDLRARVIGLLDDCNVVDVVGLLEMIPDGAIDEMCRYGASEPHVIASLIGGITAQEAIKLVTQQYIPIDNTFIYDGHSQNAMTYRL